MPVLLLPKFLELHSGSVSEVQKLALGMDLRQKGFVEKAVNTVLVGTGTGAIASTGLGFVAGGAMAKTGADVITDLIFGRAAKAGANAAMRTTAAIDKLLTVGSKTGKLAVPLATKVLVPATEQSHLMGAGALASDNE